MHASLTLTGILSNEAEFGKMSIVFGGFQHAGRMDETSWLAQLCDRQSILRDGHVLGLVLEKYLDEQFDHGMEAMAGAFKQALIDWWNGKSPEPEEGR